MVVQFERAPELQRFAREKQDVTGLVDHHRVRLPEVFPGPEQHLARGSGQCCIVHTDAKRRGELARQRAGNRAAFEKPDGPLHTVNTSHPVEVGILERFGLFEVLRVAIHDPDGRLGHVTNLAARAPQNTRENRGLVFQEESGEGDKRR